MDDDAMRSHVTQTIAEKYACAAPYTLLWSNLAALYNNHCTLYTSVLSSLFVRAPFSHPEFLIAKTASKRGTVVLHLYPHPLWHTPL